MKKAEIKALVDQHSNWFHRIDLGCGVVTPGIADSRTKIEGLRRVGLPFDLSGARVLDIGCMDGYFAFEMERRGAAVLALDRRAYSGSRIETAARCLGSTIEYRQGNVYDLHTTGLGHFDVVLFLGVLYHLRHPLLALEAIRMVMAEGSTLFLNTLILDSFLQREAGIITRLRDAAPDLLNVPLWQAYPGKSLEHDITNQFVPNIAAVKAALLDSNFRCTAVSQVGTGGFFRAETVWDEEVDRWIRNDRAT